MQGFFHIVLIFAGLLVWPVRQFGFSANLFHHLFVCWSLFFVCLFCQGAYRKNMRCGPGVVTYATGEQDAGFWRDDQLLRLEYTVASELVDGWHGDVIYSCCGCAISGCTIVMCEQLEDILNRLCVSADRPLAACRKAARCIQRLKDTISNADVCACGRNKLTGNPGDNLSLFNELKRCTEDMQSVAGVATNAFGDHSSPRMDNPHLRDISKSEPHLQPKNRQAVLSASSSHVSTLQTTTLVEEKSPSQLSGGNAHHMKEHADAYSNRKQVEELLDTAEIKSLMLHRKRRCPPGMIERSSVWFLSRSSVGDAKAIERLLRVIQMPSDVTDGSGCSPLFLAAVGFLVFQIVRQLLLHPL